MKKKPVTLALNKKMIAKLINSNMVFGGADPVSTAPGCEIGKTADDPNPNEPPLPSVGGERGYDDSICLCGFFNDDF